FVLICATIRLSLQLLCRRRPSGSVIAFMRGPGGCRLRYCKQRDPGTVIAFYAGRASKCHPQFCEGDSHSPSALDSEEHEEDRRVCRPHVQTPAKFTAILAHTLPRNSPSRKPL